MTSADGIHEVAALGAEGEDCPAAVAEAYGSGALELGAEGFGDRDQFWSTHFFGVAFVPAWEVEFRPAGLVVDDVCGKNFAAKAGGWFVRLLNYD